MPITREVLAASREMDRHVGEQIDEQTRRLVRAWSVMWGEVRAEAEAAAADLVAAADGGRVTRAQVLRSQRAARALLAIGEAVDELGREAGRIITADVADLVHEAARGQLALIAYQLPPGMIGLDFSRVSPAAMDAIATRSTQRITKAGYRLSREGQHAIRRELMRGVAVGANPRVAAARMVRGIEDKFNGGLTRALTISRTEILDAHRGGTLVADKASAGVVEGWTWSCSLGPRACMACVSMHGRTFPPSTPGPLGHQNCRCARLPVAKSWADLGFPELVEPKSILPDADAFVAKLSDADLDAMLGRRGAAAFRAGEFPREQWARRQDNPGWRASYVPAKPGHSSVSSAA